MKKKLSLTLVLVGMLAFTACGIGGTDPQPAPTDTVTPQQQAPVLEPPSIEAGLGRGIVVAFAAEPPVLSPPQAIISAAFYVTSMTHNGLFRIDTETLMPVPDLVSEWQAVSDTVFEFTIHEGIRFHNGEEMTAEDIVASFAYARTYPESINSHRSFSDFEVVDRYTVRIDTGYPNAMLFIDLASSANFIMPRSLIEAGHDFNENPVGSGPFVFENWTRGSSLFFTAFEDYFDQERAARVESVTIQIIPDGFARTVALETGEIDYNVMLQSSDIARIDADPNFSLVNVPGTQHNIMWLNNTLPQFDTPEKRRAIAMAIDKESMVWAAHDGFIDATWSQAPMPFIGASEIGAHTFDPQGSIALMEEHGIDPASLGFEIVTHAGPRSTMAEVIQANLSAVGIPVTIRMQDAQAINGLLNSGDFEAGIFGFTQSSLLGFMRTQFHSVSIGTTNRSRVDNAEIDNLIDRATAEVNDDNARNNLLADAVIIANQNSYQIPLHTATLIRAHNANLVVPEHPATDFPLYLNMVFWLD
ncbi:MAG: ABC transporter substrate-binding protein [Defluviitaleaceae bacterium]|nr:ABC transporter substrate-binding protein [Defluviitaleaceae bacterium]